MSDEHTIRLGGALPIPVGHRIEVPVFAEPGKKGLFGGDSGPQRLPLPLVRDLDTGVVHAHLMHDKAGRGFVPDRSPQGIPHQLRSDLQVVQQWRGRVLATSVCAVGGSPEDVDHIEIELRVEVLQ